MAHERTREVLWRQREMELLRAQDMDQEADRLADRVRSFRNEASQSRERARHFEVAAVTLDLKP